MQSQEQEWKGRKKVSVARTPFQSAVSDHGSRKTGLLWGNARLLQGPGVRLTVYAEGCVRET